MPNLQFYWFVVLEEFFHELYFEYQTEVIGVVVRLALLSSTHTSNLY